MFSRHMYFILFLLLITSASSAATAAWFQWRSKLDFVLVCSQTTPGEGWEKFSGPFLDARCEKLKPKPVALTAHHM